MRLVRERSPETRSTFASGVVSRALPVDHDAGLVPEGPGITSGRVGRDGGPSTSIGTSARGAWAKTMQPEEARLVELEAAAEISHGQLEIIVIVVAKERATRA